MRFLTSAQRKILCQCLVAIAAIAILMAALTPASASLSATMPAEESSAAPGLPLFVENVGQFHPDVRFQAQTDRGLLQITDNAVWLTLWTPSSDSHAALTRSDASPAPEAAFEPSRISAGGRHIRIAWADARAELVASAPVATHVSYFMGTNRSAWLRNVPVWHALKFAAPVPGFDLHIDGRAGQPLLRFVRSAGAVQAGASRPASLTIDGVPALLSAAGDLFLESEGTALHAIANAPQSVDYHFVESTRVTATQRHPQDGARESDLRAGAADLRYATFLGGNDIDQIYDLAVDTAISM